MAVLATAVWRVRPSGNNLNGGGYDTGIAGAATDYSQQNAAQATGTNGSTTGAGATTFTDATAGAFTTLMIGNCIQIASGTNFQAGFYFVISRTNANSVVLDRTPSSGGAGSVGVWKLGGGWADFTNLASTGPLVDGNVVNVLGSGTPNPASYTYDYDVTASITFGANTTIQNDSATPGYKAPPDTTGGMPVVKFDVAVNMFKSGTQNNLTVNGLYFVGTTTAAGFYAVHNSTSSGAANARGSTTVFGCVLDQFGFDLGILTGSATALYGSFLLASEVFSSVAAGSAGIQGCVFVTSSSVCVDSCNMHDLVNYGILGSSNGAPLIVLNCIIAKGQTDGILQAGYQLTVIRNCTIDGNLGHGINLTTTSQNSNVVDISSNIISNHTQAGKYGITLGLSGGAGTQGFIDYNVYYNNTANLNNVTQGAHDTIGGSNPYVGQATENYTLA
jgi:hypothetical protein